jgi:Fe-S cluster biosynthesis and repair protein YggX
MIIIIAIQEAEIGRIVVPGQPGEKILKTPISTNGWAQWSTSVIPAIAGSTK